MGFGVLGQDAARKLKMMGFDVAGWSRTPKSVEGFEVYAGEEGLTPFLARTDILVASCRSRRTRAGSSTARLFQKLARDGALGGPILINAGRGGLQVEADILACLDDGTLKAATLDVFETEPLPKDSPLWTHPARHGHAAQLGDERAGSDGPLHRAADPPPRGGRAVRERGGPDAGVLRGACHPGAAQQNPDRFQKQARPCPLPLVGESRRRAELACSVNRRQHLPP